MVIEDQITIGAAGELDVKYDNIVKVVFQQPKFIAPILRAVVPEYRDCTVDEVVNCIHQTSIDSTLVDSVSAAIKGGDSEKNALLDKVIRYDVNFTATNPKLSNGEIHVRLHIDLEVQNNYRADSSILKRAMYYVARQLDSQLGVLTEKTDCKHLEKSYSIWICNENIPKRLRGTVSLYHVTKTDIIGQTDEPKSDYDLMSVIIIRRGGNNDEEIFGYLDALFTANVDGICNYVDIRDDEELVKGAKQMEGLGASIRRDGRAEGILLGRREGIQQGRREGIIEERIRVLTTLVTDGILSVRDAAIRANMSESEFMTAMESFLSQSKR